MTTRSDNRQLSNIASFIIGSIVTVVAGYLYTSRSSSRKSVHDKKREEKRFITAQIRLEQLSRNALFFGEDGMNSITQAAVVVVGLGGVGSHAAHMLARAGVRYIRLIDFDQVM